LDVNILSPSEQDKIVFGNLITPNPILNDNDDDNKERK
jgi:hypothetical protein